MIEYKRTGSIRFLWVDGVRIGEWIATHAYRLQPPCETCGHRDSKKHVKGYSLRLYDRLWGGDDRLLPKRARNGFAAREFERLKDLKAWVEETYG